MYGLAPVWMRMWTSRWSLGETAARHTTHTNGFLPEWTRSCAARDSALWNLLNLAMETMMIPSHLHLVEIPMEGG